MQVSPVSTLFPAETSMESNHKVQTFDSSATLRSSGTRLSEKKDEEAMASPVSPAPDADDFPDGGLAAWLVVLGVSSLIFSVSFFKVPDEIPV